MDSPTAPRPLARWSKTFAPFLSREAERGDRRPTPARAGGQRWKGQAGAPALAPSAKTYSLKLSLSTPRSSASGPPLPAARGGKSWVVDGHGPECSPSRQREPPPMSGTLSRDILDASATDLVDALAARRVAALELADAAIAGSRPATWRSTRWWSATSTGPEERNARAPADAALARGERRPLLGTADDGQGSQPRRRPADHLGFAVRSRGLHRPDATPCGVARPEAAGAVILGKTNVPVGLADFQSVNPIYGRTRNPWDLSRTPAGELVRRRGRGVGRRDDPAGVRLRHRRLDPQPRPLLRPLRPQAELQPDPVCEAISRPGVPDGGGRSCWRWWGPWPGRPADLDLALGVLAGPEASEAVELPAGPAAAPAMRARPTTASW